MWVCARASLVNLWLGRINPPDTKMSCCFPAPVMPLALPACVQAFRTELMAAEEALRWDAAAPPPTAVAVTTPQRMWLTEDGAYLKPGT